MSVYLVRAISETPELLVATSTDRQLMLQEVTQTTYNLEKIFYFINKTRAREDANESANAVAS